MIFTQIILSEKKKPQVFMDAIARNKSLAALDQLVYVLLSRRCEKTPVARSAALETVASIVWWARSFFHKLNAVGLRSNKSQGHLFPHPPKCVGNWEEGAKIPHPFRTTWGGKNHPLLETCGGDVSPLLLTWGAVSRHEASVADGT